MARFGPPKSEGYLLPTTDIYDAKVISGLDINSPEFKDFLVRLQQRLNTVAIYQNQKAVGYYSLDEQVCGKTYFQDPATVGTGRLSEIPRQVYRKTYTLGALPNAAAMTYDTGLPIESGWIPTDIYGTAVNPTAAPGVPFVSNWIPLPFSSPTLNENIKLEVVSSLVPPLTYYIRITTASNYNNFTTTFVTLEFIKL